MTINKLSHSTDIYANTIIAEYNNKKSGILEYNNLTVDQTIPSFSLFGVIISGVNPEKIKNGKLTINTPLLSGDKSIFGVNKDALIHIRKNTIAHLEIEISQNEKNQLALKNIRLSFSRKIKIKNPATSLLKNSVNNPILSSLKDKISHVDIKEISVNEAGKIAAKGRIKALKVIKKNLPQELGSVDLPALDESFLRKLGIDSSKELTEGKNISHFGKKLDIKNILKKLGAVTEQASFKLNLEGASSGISLMKDGKRLQGEDSRLLVDMAGALDINPLGELGIVVKRNPHQLRCSLGSFSFEGRMNVVPKESAVALNIDGKFYGRSKNIALDGVTGKNFHDALPKRRILERISKNIEHPSTNYLVGIPKLEVHSKVNIDALVGLEKSSIKGSANANIIAHNPFLKARHRGASLSGSGSLNLDVKEFSLDTLEGIKKAQVEASINIFPNKKVLKVFPEMKNINLDYHINIDNNRSTIQPPEFGLLRFVRPMVNLEGHHERVNTKITRYAIHPIGTNEYFNQVNKITGAQIRNTEEAKLLIDGTHSMPERLRMIAEAKNDICFQTLEFKNDTSGWLFAEALVAARQRGVNVYGIVDSIGNINAINDLERKNPIYEYLISHGVALTIYNNSFEVGLRRIFGVTKKYPVLFSEPFNKSLKNISMVLDYLETVARTVENADPTILEDDRKELALGIHSLFGGKEYSSPHLFVNEFKEILSQPVVDTNNLLLALKRLGTVSYRSHEKYLVVDGEQAIVGGMNIADEYLRGGSNELIDLDGRWQPAWRDSDVLLRGEIVRDVYRCFRRNWLHNARERLPFKPKSITPQSACKASIIQHRPWEDGDDNIVNFFLYNLRTLKAGEKAWFETAYFLPRGALRPFFKELIKAAQRGVDVRILTNSKETSDFKAIVEAAVFDYRELLKAGARIFSRNRNRTVHAKVAVLGDSLTTIGSYNLDNRSASHDTEDVCALYGRAINKEMSDQLLIDMFDQSDEVKLADIESASLGKELKAAGMLLMGDLL